VHSRHQTLHAYMMRGIVGFLLILVTHAEQPLDAQRKLDLQHVSTFLVSISTDAHLIISLRWVFTGLLTIVVIFFTFVVSVVIFCTRQPPDNQEFIRNGDTRYQKVRLETGDFDCLGVGGGGTVYKYKKQNNEYKAIKFIPLKSADTANSWIREATRLSNCVHPNLVRCTDQFVVHENGWRGYFNPYQLCIVMDLVGGGDLLDLLRAKEDTFDQLEVLQIALPIADAVAHLHSLGILHRDLKPENIFVDMSAGERNIKVGDLGSATNPDDAHKPWNDWHHRFQSRAPRSKTDTKTNSEVAASTGGTEGYIAPELWVQGEELDYPIDIWSFGMVLFDLATNLQPITDVFRIGGLQVMEEDIQDPALVFARQKRIAQQMRKEAPKATVNNLRRAESFDQDSFDKNQLLTQAAPDDEDDDDDDGDDDVIARTTSATVVSCHTGRHAGASHEEASTHSSDDRRSTLQFKISVQEMKVQNTQGPCRELEEKWLHGLEKQLQALSPPKESNSSKASVIEKLPIRIMMAYVENPLAYMTRESGTMNETDDISPTNPICLLLEQTLCTNADERLKAKTLTGSIRHHIAVLEADDDDDDDIGRCQSLTTL